MQLLQLQARVWLMVRYEDITNDLRRRIRSGEFPMGSALPGTPALQQHYSAALHTVRRAQHALRDEGVVSIQAGHPTKVIKSLASDETPTHELVTTVQRCLEDLNSAYRALHERLT
jgi:DNA-binding FadR family transcriptional regulator